MIFDTHTHLNDTDFDTDREELLKSFPERGVEAFTEIGYDFRSSERAVELAKQSTGPEIYAAVGFHPDHSADMTEEDIEGLRELSKSDRVVAIGEIGLDYYYVDYRTEEEKKEAKLAKERLRALQQEILLRHPEERESENWKPSGTELNEAGLTQKEYKALKKLAETEDIKYDPVPGIQKSCFVRQIELARELKLPIVIHSRDAAKDTYDLVREHHAYENGGIVHCFSYSAEVAEQYVKLGMHIGVGGVLTFPNGRKLKEVVEKIPLESIVLETDCPYMAPVPERGSRNDSTKLSYVVRELALIKGISEEEVIRITTENARRVYRISEE